MYNKHQTSLEDACLLLDVRCHVHAWQSHHTGKLKTIRFYGVCSLFLKSFISYYAFDIQSLQSTPRVQFSADKSFQTSSGTVSSLTTIRCLFLLLFGLLGAHNTQVHVKRQSFPLVLETEESDEEVLSGSGRTGSRWGNRASAPGLSPRERNQWRDRSLFPESTWGGREGGRGLCRPSENGRLLLRRCRSDASAPTTWQRGHHEGRGRPRRLRPSAWESVLQWLLERSVFDALETDLRTYVHILLC